MSDSTISLVTGAGTRIGRAIAEGLAAEGHAVALHYNSSAEGAKALASEIREKGGRTEPIQHDLRDLAIAGDLITNASEALGGPVRVLVNSASAFNADSLASLTLDTWRLLLDVNAAAPVFLMQAFAKQNLGSSGGAIVNILDSQLSAPSPERFSYFCGKFALEGATRLAAMELAERGVRVNAVAPGLVLPSDQSEEEFLHRQSLTPLGRGLRPRHIVDAVVYLAGAEHITGHTLVVDSGQRLMGFGNAPFG